MLNVERTKFLDSPVRGILRLVNWRQAESQDLLGGANDLKDLAKLLSSVRKSDRSMICTKEPGFRELIFLLRRKAQSSA